ncbi:MAG: serine hydrolase domain-containing protein [Pseudomonadota bacterium]
MDALEMAMQAYVDEGQIAGVATLVWRDGVVHAGAVGWRDIEAERPMRRDSLFRIASMTKPITSTAALMLYDEGRFALEDPISRWAPEFERMRVLRSPEGPLEDTVEAERPITMLDLLTHRAGLTHGGFHSGPIARAYAEALTMDIDSPLAPDAWIAALAGLPLIDQPGAGFHYGASTDLLGLLIARIAGVSLGEFLAERIFRPLGMADTGFIVPTEKHDRRAKLYGFDDDGRLQQRPVHPPEGPAFLAERPPALTYESGGAGLWSTVDDYLRFARMFVGDGAVDGVRLLKVGTLRRMTANFLSPEQLEAATLLGLPVFSGQGFGLGVAVVLDPERADVLRGKGGVGTVAWPGAYGGWWQADPTDGSVMIFLAHNAIDFERAARGLGLGVYGAMTQFHALASA